MQHERSPATDTAAKHTAATDTRGNAAASGAALDPYGQVLRPGERSPAPYAASAIDSRGREFPEPECAGRSPFQRDRDRIIHSTPFRRLMHKTQVFVYHEGDHYRTRLTHSLEVAQIARTIARQLRLDEDLAETLALAHDLGHPPFGHAGERALDEVMAGHDGFDHNAQSLKVVMRLERKYRGFDGLNLTWESLEGLAKHNGPVLTGPHTAPHTAEGVEAGHNPVAQVARSYTGSPPLDLVSQSSAEAQVAALADDIAYVSHDTDDGLRAWLLELDELLDLPLVGPIARSVLTSGSHEPERARTIYEVTRAMITLMVQDCIGESRRRLAALSPSSPDDIRACKSPVIGFSPSVAADIIALKAVLFRRVYRHERVMDVMSGAQRIVKELFAHYRDHPEDLPERWQELARTRRPEHHPRLVADFVAGMTDRYAIIEHRRLFDATPDLG